MTFFERLQAAESRNHSLLCVGLDGDLKKIPPHLAAEKHPIFAFNKAIIDATRDLVSCYKPQAAYYAGQNLDAELAMTIEYIHSETDVPVILDVKRGDIGSTAEMYAKEAFDRYGADAVTVNAYMGFDAVKPFLDHAGKGVIILCRTSNPHSGDFQNLVCDGMPLFMHVAKKVRDEWNNAGNAALVVGATYPDELKALREFAPELPFLVPGVGAQGGDVEKVVRFGCRKSDGAGIMINSSRGIIYAGKDENFGAASGEAARKLRDQINSYRK